MLENLLYHMSPSAAKCFVHQIVMVLCCNLLFLFSFCIYVCFFFFSSRRRHTRCLSDWSSDVCSSDLGGNAESLAGDGVLNTDAPGANSAAAQAKDSFEYDPANPVPTIGGPLCCRGRSEERRVGKECKARGSPRGERTNAWIQ